MGVLYLLLLEKLEETEDVSQPIQKKKIRPNRPQIRRRPEIFAQSTVDRAPCPGSLHGIGEFLRCVGAGAKACTLPFPICLSYCMYALVVGRVCRLCPMRTAGRVGRMVPFFHCIVERPIAVRNAVLACAGSGWPHQANHRLYQPPPGMKRNIDLFMRQLCRPTMRKVG